MKISSERLREAEAMGFRPEVLAADEAWAEGIKRHPLLEWKALNVRQHKGR